MPSVEQSFTEAIVGVSYSHDGVDAQSPKTTPKRKWHWGKKGNVEASYDSASTNRNDYKHWRFADLNSADAAMRPEIRKKIRSRARYEVLQNNPLGLGIVLTLANDTVGTGPRLHLGLRNERYNARVQRSWHEWACSISLSDKIHTMKVSKTVDGEGLGKIGVNPYLESPVTLDFRLLECDRLEAPFSMSDLEEDYIDGVHLDKYDNPYAYDILKHHPGSDYYFSSNLEYSTFDARNIVHWFRADRPEQHRGISECQTALNLFALLRRFTLATVTAAETAANISMVMTTDTPVPDEFEEEADSLMHDFWMDSVDLERNSATILPNGWDIRQIVSQHPSTTYAMFKHELLSEIARCLCMPYNIAASNSSDHNYASGRLDHQTYHHSIRVERDRIERKILDRLFSEWMYEAALVGNVLPGSIANKVLSIGSTRGVGAISREIPHKWHWDGFAHSDPVKEAQAMSLRLKTGTSHRAIEYAKEGRDIDIEDQIAAEKAGLSLSEYRAALTVGTFFNGNAVSGSQVGIIDQEDVDRSDRENPVNRSEPESQEVDPEESDAEESLLASMDESACDEDCDCDDCMLGSTEVVASLPKGRKLNKPFRTPGGSKKFAVYVKNDNDNVVIVRFGDPNMEIKRDDPGRRKNFRARHQCDTNPGPKWKARYWSCRMWEDRKSVGDLTG